MKTFKEYYKINENRNNNFNHKLFYLVGKTKSGKYDFWKSGFKTKSGGNVVDSSLDIEDLKESFTDQGYTDVKVITGTELAIMIVSGDTTTYDGF